MDIILSIIIFILGILNIILFFKIWGMTNNVSEIKHYLINRQTYRDMANKTSQSNDDGISESRKVTRLSDGKNLFVRHIVGDTYVCLDPDTKEHIGEYKLSEIKKGW